MVCINGKYKAVISDMGGVILKFSDPKLIENLMDQAQNDENAKKILADFELGHTGVKSLASLIPQLQNKELEKEVLTLFQGLSSSVASTDEAIVGALKKLKECGFKVALLTNNGWVDDSKTKSMVPIDISYFDVVVESCRVQMRKPFPDIYLYTLEKLGLNAEECIFIDDLKMNCDAARKLGMASIQVVLGNTEDTLIELEKLTAVKLL